MGLTPAQRHADDCEILYDREHGECTCYVGEREERARLAARIATLEAALRPFAENARRFDFRDGDPENCKPRDEQDLAAWEYDEYGVTVGDLRRAREALAQPVGGGR